MTMRKDKTEAPKDWLKAITANISDTVREQLLLVQAQTEGLQLLNEAAARISEAVAEFRGSRAEDEAAVADFRRPRAKVSNVDRSEVIEVDVNDSFGSPPSDSNEVGPILEQESSTKMNDGALGANETWTGS